MALVDQHGYLGLHGGQRWRYLNVDGNRYWVAPNAVRARGQSEPGADREQRSDAARASRIGGRVMSADEICKHCGSAYYSRTAACEWLTTYLALAMMDDDPGAYPVDVETVKCAAREAGMTDVALDQAARDVKIVFGDVGPAAGRRRDAGQGGRPMKAAIYTRVSTAQQADEGYSLGRAGAPLPGVHRARGLELVETFEEAGVSAGHAAADRPWTACSPPWPTSTWS